MVDALAGYESKSIHIIVEGFFLFFPKLYFDMDIICIVHAYHISRICVNYNPALNGMNHHEQR